MILNVTQDTKQIIRNLAFTLTCPSRPHRSVHGTVGLREGELEGQLPGEELSWKEKAPQRHVFPSVTHL